MVKFKNPKYGIYSRLPRTDYSRFYRRIQRNMDYFFPKILNPGEIFNLEILRELLANETGILFNKESIRKYCQTYEIKYGSGPLIRFKDKYMLNSIFYKMKKVKPPKGYPADFLL